MEELYNVGQNMGQDVAGSPFSLEPGSMDAFSQEGLAEYMAGGGNIEEYLKSYEQMLQDGSAPDLNRGAVLDQVDAEGGITTQPKAGFVIKTRDMGAGTKIFLNVVSSEHVEAPHMKSFAELEGEEGCRVPLSVGTGLEDFDKKGEPCMTYDIVANPTVVEGCAGEPTFRQSVVELVLASVGQKYKMTLDPRFKLPKITYKGTTVQLQRIRKKKESQIQEFRDAESNAPQPGTSASRRASGEDGFGAAAASGPLPPDFCVFYSLPLAEPLQDAFSTDWGAPPQEPEEVLRTPHLCGMDLPLYRVNEFSEKFRGTMRNKAQRAQKSAEKEGDETQGGSTAKQVEVKPGEAETKEMLAGRTCVVQVRMPDLDPHVPSLKQFGLEVSDECMRLGFPMLPRSGRAAYSHLTIWWPGQFCSAHATADWDSKADTLTVSLPTEAEVHAEDMAAFNQDLLDAVF